MFQNVSIIISAFESGMSAYVLYLISKLYITLADKQEKWKSLSWMYII